MIETISFSKGNIGATKTGIELSSILLDAKIKYCLDTVLPNEAPKDMLIYTTDKNELWHGNGAGYPLTRVLNDKLVTKDVVFVMYDLVIGDVQPEILFPYFGRIKKVQLAPSANAVITQRLFMDLEVFRGGAWIQLQRLVVNVGQNKVVYDGLDIAINDEPLRFKVLDVQADLNNLVALVNIDI